MTREKWMWGLTLGMFVAALGGCSRDGSAGVSAQGAGTAQHSAEIPRGQAGSAPHAQAAGSEVDRAYPLEKYATLDSFDPLALTYLFAAYRQPALSDEEKLSALSIEGAVEKDAFKRRDLAARLLPAINARLEATRKERYYKVDVMDPVVVQHLSPRPYPAFQWTTGLSGIQHYDLDRKAFPSSCVEDGGIGGTGGNVFFNGQMKPFRSCMLPVADEATARAIEASRNRSPVVPTAATLYFYVQRAADNAVGVDAVLTHARITLYPPDVSPKKNAPLAVLDVVLPQPVAP